MDPEEREVLLEDVEMDESIQCRARLSQVAVKE